MLTQDLTILLLFVTGLGLFWLEMYVPGGLVGAAGITAILVGIALAFASHGVAAGATASAAMLALTILMLRHWMHRFSRSFLGSRMTNAAVSGKNQFVDHTRNLIGRHGVTLSRLQPGGKAQFGEEHLDVLAELDPIEPHRPVEIIHVEGIAIVVRELPPGNGV
jgi:membrane-bound ClpP family serine protease